MATGSPADVAAPVAELIVGLAAARPATAGGGRLVCVDGPAGSGKTTLAAALADRTGARVVHMDDLMAGWEGGVHTGVALAGVVEPWAAGAVGRYRRYDWDAGTFAETIEVAPAPWLVVEGVGSGSAALAPLITVLAWVEVGDDLRLARGIARDGADLAPRWRRFMADEAGLFARERTRGRADVLVDGTGRRAPVVR